MKKLPLTLLLATIVFASSAQDTASRKKSKTDKKDVRRQKINTLIKQSEEGVLIYSKQSIFGLQGRTNGFGAFYEIGRMKSNRKTNTYRLDFTEIKHQKEEKSQSAGLIFSNPYIYGKINHFYQATLGFGQQYILGQKFGKGWNEIKMKPGGFVKTAMRFDYGRFNEVVSGIEVGLSIEFYGSKIPIMVDQKDKQMFFQGYISILFGRRK